MIARRNPLFLDFLRLKGEILIDFVGHHCVGIIIWHEECIDCVNFMLRIHQFSILIFLIFFIELVGLIFFLAGVKDVIVFKVFAALIAILLNSLLFL